jgi:hypothetical protein
MILACSSLAPAQNAVPPTPDSVAAIFLGFNPESNTSPYYPLYIRVISPSSGYPTDYLAAGQMRFSVAGNLQPAYCLEIAAHLTRNLEYPAMRVPFLGGFPYDNIAYILATQDKPNITASEGAALQAAIWKLVNTPNQLVFNNSSIDAAANAMITASLGQGRPLACADMKLTLALKADSDNLLHALVTLAQPNGQAVPNQNISFFEGSTPQGSAQTQIDGTLDYQLGLAADNGVTISAKTQGFNVYELQSSTYQDVVSYERCPLAVSSTFQCPDRDVDGICDDNDNCPDLTNADQTDTDVDGMGDRCDSCPLDSANDADHDGICGNIDLCPATIIPDPITYSQLNPNHWALINNDGIFDTKAPKGKGPGRYYTIQDTAGCSCAQIIVALGLGDGHVKQGCSISAMDDWLLVVSQY